MLALVIFLFIAEIHPLACIVAACIIVYTLHDLNDGIRDLVGRQGAKMSTQGVAEQPLSNDLKLDRIWMINYLFHRPFLSIRKISGLMPF